MHHHRWIREVLRMTTSMLLGSRRLTRIWRFWRTPKGLMLLILAGLVAAAVPQTGGHPVQLVLAGAAAACALEVLITFALRAEWEFPSGALLTGMFVAGVLSPYERLDVIVVTALLAILGKHVFRLGGVHVFNPAALALVVSAVALGTGQSWWAALPELNGVGAVVVAVSGIYIAQRLNKLPMIAAFLGTYFALFTASAVLGAPSQVAEMFRAPDLQAVLFFAFFMLDDPPTSPVRHRDQLVFGVLVALTGYVVFMQLGSVYYLLAGLLVGNLVEAVRRTVVKWRRAARARSRAQTSVVRTQVGARGS
jgi:Na+-translocating ferredoxin:NAD+ oxidoreductase RnfD subunit